MQRSHKLVISGIRAYYFGTIKRLVEKCLVILLLEHFLKVFLIGDKLAKFFSLKCEPLKQIYTCMTKTLLLGFFNMIFTNFFVEKLPLEIFCGVLHFFHYSSHILRNRNWVSVRNGKQFISIVSTSVEFFNYTPRPTTVGVLGVAKRFLPVRISLLHTLSKDGSHIDLLNCNIVETGIVVLRSS